MEISRRISTSRSLFFLFFICARNITRHVIRHKIFLETTFSSLKRAVPRNIVKYECKLNTRDCDGNTLRALGGTLDMDDISTNGKTTVSVFPVAFRGNIPYLL